MSEYVYYTGVTTYIAQILESFYIPPFGWACVVLFLYFYFYFGYIIVKGI